MPDITMCAGGGCPFKEKCYRFTAKPNEYRQSYFSKPPYKIQKKKPSCEMFWGDAAEKLLIEMKSIMNGKAV